MICAVSRLDPAATALVLIDFQNEYVDGKLPLPAAWGWGGTTQQVRAVKRMAT